MANSNRICSIPDCDKPLNTKGLCRAHYRRLWRYGDPLAGCAFVGKPNKCSVEECHAPARAKGLCDKHYTRNFRHGDPSVDRKLGRVQEYYQSVVLQYDGDECLIWPYSTIRGYGRMQNDGNLAVVSRALCKEVHGPAPTPAHDAAHSCGNGHLGCVTKKHLSWKTRAENMADRVLHGTSNRGERHASAKLTEEQAREIISLRGKEKQKDTASRFGIAPQTVSGIQLGQKWIGLNRAQPDTPGRDDDG